MAKKPLTYSEQIVGRKCPAMPKYMDTYLASYVINPDEPKFGAKFTPSDSWMRPSHKKARQQRLVTLVDKWSIMGGRPIDRWQLTEKGKEAALQAFHTTQAIYQARSDWGKEFIRKHKEINAESATINEEIEDNGIESDGIQNAPKP